MHLESPSQVRCGSTPHQQTHVGKMIIPRTIAEEAAQENAPQLNTKQLKGKRSSSGGTPRARQNQKGGGSHLPETVDEQEKTAQELQSQVNALQAEVMVTTSLTGSCFWRLLSQLRHSSFHELTVTAGCAGKHVAAICAGRLLDQCIAPQHARQRLAQHAARPAGSIWCVRLAAMLPQTQRRVVGSHLAEIVAAYWWTDAIFY